MWQKELDYAMASNLYYHELENGNYTRAEQFVKNVGGKKVSLFRNFQIGQCEEYE